MSRLAKLCAWFGILLSVAACASSATTISPTSSEYARYLVERDVVVRRTAQAGADPLGRLSAGTIVIAQIQDIGDGWFRIHSDNGGTGYIFGKPLRSAE